MTEQLVAPFPYFGGKRKIVSLVWPRFGTDVNSYLEPFFGSGAMLLGRPGGAGKYETVNDLSGHLVNFWRSVRADPMEVARYADYPVSETDQCARQVFLVNQLPSLEEKLLESPDYFNAKLAGWWVWGKSCWIGDGWCRHPDWKARPDITGSNGVHAIARQLPDIAGRRGVQVHRKIPELHGNKGVHAEQGGIYDRMMELSDRLRHVRICAGDWERILSSASMGTNASGVAQGIAPCAIFLDPAYPGHEDLYDAGEGGVTKRVQAFCQEHGENPLIRIALCGYDGNFDLPGWEVVAWKAHGGYGNQTGKPNDNAHRERVWFSPHCLKPERQHRIDDLVGYVGRSS